MPIQTIIFGLLLASLYGTLFHVWKGGKPWRLLVLLILSWVGFWVGHFLGNNLGIKFFMVGALNAGFASIISLITLGAGYWLIMGRHDIPSDRKS